MTCARALCGRTVLTGRPGLPRRARTVWGIIYLCPRKKVQNLYPTLESQPVYDIYKGGAKFQ